jgi:hypothetical protein
MSLTDLDKLDARLRALFRQDMVSAGERLRAAGNAVALHPDADVKTYYTRRLGVEPLIFSEEDVQLGRIGDHWEKSGRGELRPLAVHLESLRAELPPTPDSAEVSSFIYAMF